MFLGKTAIVTGAGQGIGRAIAIALAGEGMRVCVSDMDAARAQAVAREIGGVSVACDVRDPMQIAEMVNQAQAAFGQIDMLVSNAGFARGALDGPASTEDAHWQDSWDVHVMAHLRGARLVLPGMLDRGEGWLVNIASAAGLLSQIGDAPYSATKHAAVSLAQSLAIEHGHQGVNVSVVCPLYVATPLLGYSDDDQDGRPHDRVLTAQDVSDALLTGLKARQFLVLPHPEAGDFFRKRAADMDAWINGMQRLRSRVYSEDGPNSIEDLHRLI